MWTLLGGREITWFEKESIKLLEPEPSTSGISKAKQLPIHEEVFHFLLLHHCLLGHLTQMTPFPGNPPPPHFLSTDTTSKALQAAFSLGLAKC